MMNRASAFQLFASSARGLWLPAALAFTLLAGCYASVVAEEPPRQDRDAEERRVVAVLDALHTAASLADGATYFALFEPEAVYFGTDPSERWSVAEFRAFAEPYFSQGRGWTYAATERHVFFSPAGDCAWFDERLWNESYGETRGTGVLERSGPPGSPWLITQYNLTIPVPNELAGDLVERIREHAAGG